MTTRRFFCAFILFFSLPVFLFSQKETPPEGGKPRDFKLPHKVTFKLQNGLAVTMVKYGEVPKVSVMAALRVGNVNELADEIWLASLTANMLKEGTANRSAQEIRNEAAMMGGSVDVGVSGDQTSVSGEVLSESAAGFIELIGDVLKNPKFPEPELPRLKNDKVRELSLDLSSPQALTGERFQKVIYAGHPYGRGFPTEAMLLGYSIDQVRKFYNANFCAMRTHIYIAGRFDEKAVRSAIEKAFKGWKKGDKALVNIPKPSVKKEIFINERAGAPQSTIQIGLPVIDPSNKDYIPLQVTNSLLGGSFASRITSNIREQKGYTYSPYSAVSVKYRTAYWSEVADVTTNVTGASLKEILYEVNKLRTEAPPQEELKGIQNYMAGTFVLQNSSRTGIIGILSFLDFHGLPDTYLTDYVKSVHAVTPEKVKQTTLKYIRPDDMVIVITGDKEKIAKQVEEFGKIAD